MIIGQLGRREGVKPANKSILTGRSKTESGTPVKGRRYVENFSVSGNNNP